MPKRSRKRMRQTLRICKRGRCRLLNDRTVLKHRDAVGDAQRELDIVGNQQDATARIGKGAKVCQSTDGKIEIEAGGRLVCDQQTGLLHERAHEQNAPRHAAGQLVRVEPLYLFTEPIGAKELALTGAPAVSIGTALCTGLPAGKPAYLIAHPHKGVQSVDALRHKSDAVTTQRRQALSVTRLSIKPNVPAHVLVMWKGTEQTIGKHRLAGAGRANERQDLAFVHR